MLTLVMNLMTVDWSLPQVKPSLSRELRASMFNGDL